MEVISEANLEYESEIKRNPGIPRIWLNYLADSKQSSHEFRTWLYSRAVDAFPRFYKIWVALLRDQVALFFASGSESGGSHYEFVCRLFEKALSNLNKLPRIWLMYIEFLIDNRYVTTTRRVINRCLRALPITQHSGVWDLVINQFIGSEDMYVPVDTCKLLLRRYLQFEPGYADAVISYLVDRGDVASAVELLIHRIEESEGDSSSRLLLLIELISKNSNKLKSVQSIDLPSVIRTGIQKYPSKLGELWNALSDYYIRLGMFSKAIEVYEEGLESVQTVVDFSVIFESYQNFLELIVQTQMAENSAMAEMDLQRLELLIDRRSELLSAVLLRQNPHNITEWIKRTKLPRIAADPDTVTKTFMHALNAVDPHSSHLAGRVSSLWIEFAKFYASQGDFDTARAVFEKAVSADYRSSDDLASVWIEWVLIELRLVLDQEPRSFVQVLETARRSISQFRGAPKNTVQSTLYRSVKLWHLAADIELSLHGESKPDLVRALYDAMIDLRVITPQTVLNYAKFELEKLYFEKAIQVLERGIALFPWPHCRDIWLFYLDLVVGQSKQRFSTERVRDLFEQAVRDVDPKFASVFFFKFFQFELERGLASDAVAVLTKAVACIPLHEKLGFYQLATARMMELSGLAGARRILQGAIDAMTETAVKSPAADRYIITLCLEYARFQAEVGQADRARKLYEHGSQFANPNKADLLFFWDMWKNFEVEHGSEDTYKEMKRTRRLVDVQYSDKHFNTLDVGMEVGSTAPAEEPESVSVSAAPKIDISKLRQMAQMKKQGQAAVPAGEAFLASDTFAGSKPGYVFTSGPQGVGYYRDSSSA